jgi:hypothetical protein
MFNTVHTVFIAGRVYRRAQEYYIKNLSVKKGAINMN